MTESDIICEVKSELGSPTVKVELDDTVWEKIFTKAKRWFRAKKGVISCYVLNLVDGQTEYDMPPNSVGLIDVVLPNRTDIASLLSFGFFDVIPMNAWNIGSLTSSFNSYSSYVQILQALETRRRVFSADPDWYEACGKIHITVKSLDCFGNGGTQALVFFKKQDFDISELKERDEELIYRYSLNEAKYRLGRVRGKYKSYPAAGGSIDTDADDLIADYKEEKELLEEEISESQGSMGFVVG